jgi:hypothetical protein
MQLRFSRRKVTQHVQQKSPRSLTRRLHRFDRLEDRQLLSAGGGVVPSGPQFMVNTTIGGTQQIGGVGAPYNVAMDNNGDTVVAWSGQQLNSSGQPTGNWNLMFQLYTRTYDSSIGSYDLQTLGGQTLIATSANASVEVARAPNSGDFVALWATGGSTYVQLYSSSGAAIGSPLTVISGDNAYQIVMSDSGFDVLYGTGKTSFTTGDFYVQRFSYNATSDSAVGSPITVAVGKGTDHDSQDVSLATDASGDFVVVWTNNSYKGNTLVEAIDAQRYTSAGKANGGIITVSGATTYAQSWGSVGMDAAGDFVVAWGEQAPQTSAPQSKWPFNLMACTVSASGTVGTPIDEVPAQPDQYNSATGQWLITDSVWVGPNIAVQSGAGFDIAYPTFSQTGAGGDFADTFNASGAALQTPFAINSLTIATDSFADMVNIWTAAGTGGTNDVFGQFYIDPPAPPAAAPSGAASPSGAATPSGSTTAAVDAVFGSLSGDDDTLA